MDQTQQIAELVKLLSTLGWGGGVVLGLALSYLGARVARDWFGGVNKRRGRPTTDKPVSVLGLHGDTFVSHCDEVSRDHERLASICERIVDKLDRGETVMAEVASTLRMVRAGQDALMRALERLEART